MARVEEIKTIVGLELAHLLWKIVLKPGEGRLLISPEAHVVTRDIENLDQQIGEFSRIIPREQHGIDPAVLVILGRDHNRPGGSPMARSICTGYLRCPGRGPAPIRVITRPTNR